MGTETEGGEKRRKREERREKREKRDKREEKRQREREKGQEREHHITNTPFSFRLPFVQEHSSPSTALQSRKHVPELTGKAWRRIDLKRFLLLLLLFSPTVSDKF